MMADMKSSEVASMGAGESQALSEWCSTSLVRSTVVDAGRRPVAASCRSEEEEFCLPFSKNSDEELRSGFNDLGHR